MSGIFNYQTYSEIDLMHKHYLLYVYKQTDITMVSLPEINSFLNDMWAYYRETNI